MAVLQVRCPMCDAPIETRAVDTLGHARCSQCGYTFDPANQTPITGATVGSRDGDSDWAAPTSPGQQLFRVVQRLVRRPSFTLKVPHGAGPSQSISPARPRHASRLFHWFSRPELRRILFAAIVFLGVPAAVIFFVIVVCAPKEDAVVRRPVRAARPQAAKADQPSWLRKFRP